MSIDHLYCVSTSSAKGLFVAGLMLSATLTTGTGGGYFSENPKDWIHHPYIGHRLPIDLEVTEEKSIPIDVRMILEHIENIKNVFDMPISGIADMLDVSRQAVYKWLANTSTPEQSKQELIKVFSQVADKFKEAGIKRSGVLLKMKAFAGRSLKDILLAGEASDYHIMTLINEAKIMESSYNKSGLSESKAKPTNEWQSSVSIPGFPEKK